MKINTDLLQKMVAKAIQGASFNKMIPLTSLIGINVSWDEDQHMNKIELMTTDGSNQFRINGHFEKNAYESSQHQDFYTIVDADTFSKLVGKTTKEYIELTNKENYLEVVGNGSYKLEIAINEEGEMVKFPEIQNINAEPFTISTQLLQEVIRTAKASVAKTMEIPCLTGYYISDKTISTDRQLIFLSKVGLSKEPLLISSEMAELLLLIDSEDINVLHNGNNLIFFNQTFKIAGKELEGKETYPVSQITALIDSSYENIIKVNKQELLNILDRMSIFVTDYDKNGIFLNFTSNQLCIKSQKSNAIESTNYIDNELANIFECLVDIEMLKSQVETISTDKVEIQYGQEKSIKIVDGNVTHIISLLTKTN